MTTIDEEMYRPGHERRPGPVHHRLREQQQAQRQPVRQRL